MLAALSVLWGTNWPLLKIALDEIDPYLWFRLLEVFPSSVAAIGTLGGPVVGVLSSALIVGEPIGAGEIAALGLVVSAQALVLPRSAPARRR